MPSHLPRGTKSVIIDAIVGPKNTEPHYLPRGAKIGIMIGSITGLIIGTITGNWIQGLIIVGGIGGGTIGDIIGDLIHRDPPVKECRERN